MLLNLIDKNCAKILIFLAISPGSKYKRKEIKENTKINNVPLDISINKLLFLKLINEKRKIYSLNLENQTLRELLDEAKRVANLPLKIKFILIDFLAEAAKIKNIGNIILFGSYSKLIFTDKSDIDLAIIYLKEKNKSRIEKLIGKIATKISRKMKKELQVHFFSEQDLKHKEDPLIKDIIRNGISLV